MCYVCDVIYTEAESLGAWECTYHPGKLNAWDDGMNHSKYCYDCCGYSPVGGYGDYVHTYRNGCTRCDHREYDTPYGPKHNVSVSPMDIRNIHVRDYSSKWDTRLASYVVMRYDAETAARRRRYGNNGAMGGNRRSLADTMIEAT